MGVKTFLYGEPRTGLGPVKWCRLCGHKHRARATCDLFLRSREAKSGRIVKRWAA